MGPNNLGSTQDQQGGKREPALTSFPLTYTDSLRSYGQGFKESCSTDTGLSEARM